MARYSDGSQDWVYLERQAEQIAQGRPKG
jgi:hypothetical protein